MKVIGDKKSFLKNLKSNNLIAELSYEHPYDIVYRV